MTFPDFCDALREYCARTKGSVTSWIRTPIRNAAVGGVPHSAHLSGMGADVVYDIAIDQSERQAWADRLGLFLYVEGDHDHVQAIPWKAG